MEKYVCPICGKKFESITALKTDIVMHENEEKTKIKMAEELKKREAEAARIKELKELDNKINNLREELIAAIHKYNRQSTDKAYTFELKSQPFFKSNFKAQDYDHFIDTFISELFGKKY